MFFRKFNSEPDTPRSFGWNSRWLAVESSDSDCVIELIGLNPIGPCSWLEGLKKIQQPLFGKKLFVTPSLSGWVLIANYSLPNYTKTKTSSDHLAMISNKVGGKVCWFSSFASVSCHAWGIANNGITERLYGCSDGQVFFNFGEKSLAENELNIKFHEEIFYENDIDYDSLANENTVFDIARLWSIDPTHISDFYKTPCTGIITKAL